jgi:hypothetical protein
MTNQLLAINWLKQFSIETWNRIGFTWASNRGNLHEVTLTQNLVFQLNYQFRFKKLPFELWEALDENANGNDLELAVETPSGYLLFPCQAKIINRRGKYNKINHAPNGKLQIDSLLEYADNLRGMPIYLLYNYSNDEGHLKKSWPNQYEHMVSHGCAIVSAKYLSKEYCFTKKINGQKKWRSIPTFEKLLPNHGLPLHQFIELLLNTGIDSLPLEYTYLEKRDFRYYAYDRLYDTTRWINLTPLERLSDIIINPDPKSGKFMPPGENDEFRPRFRIIIPQ